MYFNDKNVCTTIFGISVKQAWPHLVMIVVEISVPLAAYNLQELQPTLAEKEAPALRSRVL